ncbi:MAG: disulfide bond formation protein B [Candidatus Liptonbacteria bacterium]
MTPLVSTVTYLLSLGTVIGGIVTVALFIFLVAHKRGAAHPISNRSIIFFGHYAVLFSFLIAAFSMLGSLFYSEVAGFAPCVLCWWQRVFLYPQAFILLYAMIKKRDDVAPYSILLSIVGGAIALYHTYIQFGGSPFILCSASGISVSCVQRYFLEFGYVTLPTMSLTGFAMILVFMWADRVWRKEGGRGPVV